jgi:hypothetical protein
MRVIGEDKFGGSLALMALSIHEIGVGEVLILKGPI